MELIRWNPMRDMFGMQRRLNHFMDDFFYPKRNIQTDDTLWQWNPNVDIYDKDDHIVLKAELPGIEKDHIEIDVKDRVLTLKGERSLDNEVEEDNYYRRERSFGKFVRSFTLPVNVKVEDIQAEFKNGLLKVNIPKPTQEQPRKITVQ